MMTRKDYVATAEIINSYADEIKTDVLEDLVNDFIEMFNQIKHFYSNSSIVQNIVLLSGINISPKNFIEIITSKQEKSARLRELRLRALADAPYAFGAAY